MLFNNHLHSSLFLFFFLLTLRALNTALHSQTRMYMNIQEIAFSLNMHGIDEEKKGVRKQLLPYRPNPRPISLVNATKRSLIQGTCKPLNIIMTKYHCVYFYYPNYK